MKLGYIFDSLVSSRTDEVVIATMTAGYLWPKHSTSDRDFCYIAPMGSAAAVGLGLALARPDLRVWVLDGDGSVLMNLGVLVTIAARKPPNLVHMVMSNGEYAITGGQPVVGTGVADLSAIASASGIATAHRIRDDDAWQSFVTGDLHSRGPIFADVHVETAYEPTAIAEYTLGAQAQKTQGGPGYHNLRHLLNA